MTELRDLGRAAAAVVDEATALVGEMALDAVEAKGARDTVVSIDLAVEDRVRTFICSKTPEIRSYGAEAVTPATRTARQRCGRGSAAAPKAIHQTWTRPN